MTELPEDDIFSDYLNYRDAEETSERSTERTAEQSNASTSKRSSFSFTPTAPKSKKLKGEKSFVWRYFTKLDDKKVQCEVPVERDGIEVPCKVTYKFTGSTSNLKYHLNVAHSKTEDDDENPKVNFKILLKQL